MRKFLLPCVCFLILTQSFCKPKGADRILLESVSASSTKDAELRPASFTPYHIFDQNGNTSWCSQEAETTITAKFAEPIAFNNLIIQNGYKSASFYKNKKGENVLNEKQSKVNFKMFPSLKQGKISVFLSSDRPKNLQWHEIKLDDLPKNEIDFQEEMYGDTLVLQVLIPHLQDRPATTKENICLTGLDLGLKTTKSNHRFPVKFTVAGLEVDWSDYYHKTYADFFNFSNENADLAECLIAKTCKAYNRTRIASLDSGDIKFGFNWEKTEENDLVKGKAYTITPSDADITFNYFDLKPLAHSQSGLVFSATDVLDQKYLGELTFNWEQKADLGTIKENLLQEGKEIKDIKVARQVRVKFESKNPGQAHSTVFVLSK